MACGPYPELDGCSSMDLYASRLTHSQDIFSFASYYPALPIYLIGQNISAPTVVLESPTFEIFTEEVKNGYDYIGINFNTIFFDQVLKMCRIIRRLSPETKIVLGGYGVCCLKENFQEEQELVKMVDHVCHGEGIRFMRELLGEPTDAPIKQDFPISDHYCPVIT